MGTRGPSPGTGGRPRKALSDKIAKGNLGKRPLTVMEFDNAADLVGADMPQPSEMLSAVQKDGSTLQAAEIYETTWNWLNERSYAVLVSPQLLERYAMAAARWIHCEEAISEYGYLIKRANGSAATSPYVQMSNEYRKQANNLYYQIYQVVKENASIELSGDAPIDDVMERLLRAREGR